MDWKDAPIVEDTTSGGSWRDAPLADDKQPAQAQQNPFITALQTARDVAKTTAMSSLPSPSAPIGSLQGMGMGMLPILGRQNLYSQVREQGKEALGVSGLGADILLDPGTYESLAMGFGGGGKAIGKDIGEIISAKMSSAPAIDKVMMDRSERVFKAADSAVNNINQDYAIFRNAVEDTPVNADKLQGTINNLYGKAKTAAQKNVPQFETKLELPSELKEELGQVFKDENIRLKNVFGAKDAIAKHIKDKTWVNYKMGLEVSPEQEHLVKSYFELDKLIDSSLEKGDLVEEKQMLDYMNKRATDVHKLARQAKDLVTKRGSVTRDPTKLIETFTNVEKGIGGRNTLNQLAQLEPELNDIIGKMNKYRSTKVLKKVLERFGLAGEAGGAVGAGLGIAQKLLSK